MDVAASIKKLRKRLEILKYYISCNYSARRHIKLIVPIKILIGYHKLKSLCSIAESPQQQVKLIIYCRIIRKWSLKVQKERLLAELVNLWYKDLASLTICNGFFSSSSAKGYYIGENEIVKSLYIFYRFEALTNRPYTDKFTYSYCNNIITISLVWM